MNYKRLNGLRTSNTKYGVLIKKLSKLSEKAYQKIFFEAVKDGNIDCVNFLLANSANPAKILNTYDDFYNTPLMIAAFLQDYNLTKFLLENGADISVRDKKGINPELLADETRYVVRKFWGENLLFDGKEHIWHRNGGNDALMMLLSKRDVNLKIVQLLIDYGADINAKNDEGFTPLMFAVENGNVGAVKLLLKYGAKVNVQDIYGNSILLHAVSNMYIKDLVPILIFSGANPKIKNNAGIDCYNTKFANVLGQKEIDEAIKLSKVAKVLNIGNKKEPKRLENKTKDPDNYFDQFNKGNNDRIMA